MLTPQHTHEQQAFLDLLSSAAKAAEKMHAAMRDIAVQLEAQAK